MQLLNTILHNSLKVGAITNLWILLKCNQSHEHFIECFFFFKSVLCKIQPFKIVKFASLILLLVFKIICLLSLLKLRLILKITQCIPIYASVIVILKVKSSGIKTYFTELFRFQNDNSMDMVTLLLIKPRASLFTVWDNFYLLATIV